MKNKSNEKNGGMQNAHRTSQGITLVALVITVIVLLILAGVAINMAVNSDGLFAKANEAVEGWNSAVGEEKNSVQNLLNHMGISAPVELPAGWDSTKIASTVKETSEVTGTTKEREVPIPKGFTPSQVEGENTIAGGLVIYQTEETVTAENHDTALTTYNQYVWIPVDDINAMVMCKSNTGASPCNIVLQADGTLQCTNSAHETNKTNLCGRLYGVDSTTTDTATPKKYTTNMNFLDRSQTWTDNSGYREPDIVSSEDKDDSTSGKNYMELAGIGDKTVASFSAQLTNDFKNMAASVAKYGGFYVSRYEVGENGASKKNQPVLTATESSSGNYIGANTWYGLYGTLRKEIKQGETKILQSHMIYGSQYDQIIHFAGEEAQTGHSGNVVTTQSLTGTKETDKLKNIYDLEGNNYEWTAQADYTSHRVSRGGVYNYAYFGSFNPASCHGFNDPPTSTIPISTSRSALYL